MLNVTVNPLVLSRLDAEGYWFDFEDNKTTLRNQENMPLFEIIHNQITHGNILLTKKDVCYANVIDITFDEERELMLLCKTVEQNEVIIKKIHQEE